MEYRRLENSNIVEIWKNDELIGQMYPVDELWKMRVYMTVAGKRRSEEGELSRASG